MTFIKGNKLDWIHALLMLLIICTVASISILAWVPPVSRDALTHHLFVPRLYLLHGGIYEIPHLTFSYYPMNLDLLYMGALYFKNDILPKFIHFAFALATGALIHRYLKKRISPLYGLLGALFFLTIPVIVRLSSTVYVDLGLIFFLFASLLCLFRWIESGFKKKFLFFSAVLCGLALGTKYNGLVGLFLLGLFTAFAYARHNGAQKSVNLRAAGWGAIFVATALLVFSPWMIRNFAWTGNPIYPLYTGVFDTEKAPEKIQRKIETRSRISHFQVRRHIYGESWTEIALIPLRVFFQGEDDNPRYFDGKTNPFLLVLSIFAFFGVRSLGRQEKTEKFMMLFFSVLFLLYACAQAGIRIRYFSPILPPLVVLSMYGLYNLQTFAQNRLSLFPVPLKKIVTIGIVLAMFGMNAKYIAARFEKDRPFSYISGRVTRDQYIQQYRPEYASFQYANRNLSDNDKIFGLYLGNRGYYCDIPIKFENKLIGLTTPDVESGKAIAKKLQKQGFTHMLMSLSMHKKIMPEKSAFEKKIINEFFKNHTEMMFAKDGYGLLLLK